LIEPVVPFRLTSDWNLITRTIVPVIDQPTLAPGLGNVSGLGDVQRRTAPLPRSPWSATRASSAFLAGLISCECYAVVKKEYDRLLPEKYAA
jgi:hypothetical protein